MVSQGKTSLDTGCKSFGAFLSVLISAPVRPVFLVFLALAFFLSAVHVLRRRSIRTFTLLKMNTSYMSMLVCTLASGICFFLTAIAYGIYYAVSRKSGYDRMIGGCVVGIAAMVLLCPFKVLCWRARKNFLLAFYEIAIGRYKTHHIPFKLVILADIFTSYSFFIACLISMLPFKDTPLALKYMKALPLLFRVRQCLQDYYGSRAPRHLVNTLKYVLGIATVVLFDTFHLDHSDTDLNGAGKGAVIATITFASLLSLYWDLVMDWNMNFWGFRSYTVPSHNVSTVTLPSQAESSDTETVGARHETSDEEAAVVKKDIGKMGRFSALFYSFAIVYDIFGRFINIIKAFCYLSAFSGIRCLFISELGIFYAIIEAIRRFVWSIIRIENYQSQILYLEANK